MMKGNKSTNAEAVEKRITDKQKEILEVFTKYMGNATQICNAVGIGRKAYYEWLRNYPEFAKDIELAKDVKKDLIENKFYKAVEEGDVRAILFGMESICGHSKKQDINVESRNQTVVFDAAEMDDMNEEMKRHEWI